ncbi:DMT family transporter [Candidatus Roizmanbacteria bacterium]|nr:DMT family transporter [Candidatus Roizmanbacteria bacterium]
MVFIILAALLWSLDGILRRGLYTLPPTVVVFLEHALGAIILFPFVFKSLKEIKNLNRKEWLSILVVSLFSGALGTIFYTAALGKVNYIQFSVVVLLQQLQPIWAILTAAIVLKEKVTKKFIPWAFLAIGASYLVTFKDLKLNWQTGQGTIVASVLALLAGMMWAASTSFSKIVLRKISFQVATFLRFVLAPIFALIFLFGLKQTNQLAKINPNQWISLLIIVFSTGLVALLFYYFGLKKTQAKISAILELTWPVSAIFIDFLYFKNSLSVTQLIGAFLVLFSMYKVSKLKNG